MYKNQRLFFNSLRTVWVTLTHNRQLEEKPVTATVKKTENQQNDQKSNRVGIYLLVRNGKRRNQIID